MSILTLLLMMLLMLLVTLIFFVNAVNGDADVDHNGNFFFFNFWPQDGIIAVQGRTTYLSMNYFVIFFIFLYLSKNASFHVGIAGCSH